MANRDGVQRHPTEYVQAPSNFLRAGQPLAADLYIYLPLNKSFVHFRRQGDVLTANEIQQVTKQHEGHVLILRSERNKQLLEASRTLGETIREKGVDSPQVQQMASAVLHTLDGQDYQTGRPSGEVARAMLTEAPAFVEQMIAQFSKTPALAAYDEVLKGLKGKSDPLSLHHQQVSALAVLMMLSLGGCTMDDLTDVGAAGLIHDQALKFSSQDIMRKHLSGDNTYNTSEKIVYLKHIDMVLEMVQVNHMKVSPGTVRAIQFHHENWDGSGFKQLAGKQIFYPARVLRLADDITGLVSRPGNNMGFKDTLRFLAAQKGAKGVELHDPEMAQKLLSL